MTPVASRIRASIRVELNKPNIGAMLKSAEMANAILPYARRIKARADAGSGDDGHEVKVLPGGDRVSVIVVAKSWPARRAEHDSRNLTKAIEAGRG